MKKYTKVFYKIYVNVINSIAFFPFLIAGILFLLSVLILYFEGTHFSTEIKKSFPYLFVSGYENAREILSTLITGIISLTVFSFSMVMIVLNQASSNFSPRVIPGVITKKAHQVVLGFCVGTIIYSLIILHNVQSTQKAIQFPQIGVFIGEILGIVCLILFVYFIHSISQSIQVDNILIKILNDTLISLKTEKKNDENREDKNPDFEEPETNGWICLASKESGYYRNFEVSRLVEILKKENLVIEILVPKGSFIVKHFPFIKINQEIDDDLKKSILDSFIFYQEEFNHGNYIYGFKQTSEVAVKALSPGINDPGTAVRAINHLTLMFSEMLHKKMNEHFFDSEEYLRVIQRNNSFDELLYNYLTPIREYGKKDVNIMLQLLKCLDDLLHLENGKKRYLPAFHKHINIIREDAGNSIFNKIDREKINILLNRLNFYFDNEEDFQKL